MAEGPSERIALLSIHPRYADAIFDGDKQVEFRKAALRDDVRQALVYSTSPVQRIVGVFRIERVDRATPAQLWERYHHVGCIAPEDYASYYASWSRGAAIVIGEAWRLPAPLPLTVLGSGMRPPQSYQYLHAAVLDAVLADGACERPPRFRAGVSTDVA